MKKKIISIALAFCVFTSSVVSASAIAAEAAQIAIGLVALMQTAINAWNDSASSASEKGDALKAYKEYWYSSATSGYGYVDVSYDALSDVLFDLNDKYQPARIIYSSAAGGYVIQSIGEFGYYYSSSGVRYSIWDNTGKYFGTPEPTGYIFRAPYNTDSILGDIRFALSNYPSQIAGKLSTISDTLTDKLSTISTTLSSFQSNVQNALVKLYSKVSGLSDAATGDYDSQVYSDLPTMFSRMGHDYYYGTSDERTAISAAFDRYWLTSMSASKSYVSPEVLNDICADLNKANIRCSVYYDADLGLSYIKGLGGPYIVDPSDWNPSGTAYEALSTSNRIFAVRELAVVSSNRNLSYYASQASARLLKTADNVQYTVADLQYNTWQQIKNAVTKLGSIDTRLSTLHSDATGLGSKLDNIAELLNTTSFTCSYKTDASGTAYPTQTIPYDVAVQIAARINSEMLGKQATVIKRDGSGTVPITISRCQIDSNGYIIVRTDANGYFLCGKDNTLFVADQDYTKSIYSRLSDVISAVNNLTVGVDLSDVPLSVDASSINLFNNAAYCCGYLTDADGNLYPTLPIPYDSAAAIVERLNTDYIDKKITVLQRSGSTFTGSVKHAYIAASGNINLRLTNGYGYALCDSANTIYQVDASTNYGSRANETLLGVSSRLDAIIGLMQATGGEYTCQHTYTQEMEQEATCILPGLMVSTCTKCGNSYSEIVGALDHDWVLSEHVDAVTDPETEEVTQSAYDIYTCSRCGQSYEDHSGTGAPTDYGETSIAKIIVKLFAKLGTLAGKIIGWIVDLFTKTLGGINDLFTRFTELTTQITSFGGDYPTWLTGFWSVLSPDLQLALSFAFLCIFVGVIGKKLFFS